MLHGCGFGDDELALQAAMLCCTLQAQMVAVEQQLVAFKAAMDAGEAAASKLQVVVLLLLLSRAESASSVCSRCFVTFTGQSMLLHEGVKLSHVPVTGFGAVGCECWPSCCARLSA
jgi:hypothetical protein